MLLLQVLGARAAPGPRQRLAFALDIILHMMAIAGLELFSLMHSQAAQS